MAQLTITDLDDEVRRRLAVRAGELGRSVEEEARDILTATVMMSTLPVYGQGTLIAEAFRGIGLSEAEAQAINNLRTQFAPDRPLPSFDP